MEDSQEKLLSAAIELFSEKGYAATSMSMVASKAGLSKASVFHHFASKERLYDEVLEAVFSSINNILQDLEKDFTTDFSYNIGLITAAVLSFEEDNASSIKLIIWELMNPSTEAHQAFAKQLLNNSFNNTMELTVRAHKAAITRKRIDPEEIALKITAQITHYFIFGDAFRDTKTTKITNSANSFLNWLTDDIVS